VLFFVFEIFVEFVILYERFRPFLNDIIFKARNIPVLFIFLLLFVAFKLLLSAFIVVLTFVFLFFLKRKSLAANINNFIGFRIRLIKVLKRVFSVDSVFIN